MCVCVCMCVNAQLCVYARKRILSCVSPLQSQARIPTFFARKFDSRINNEIVNRVEEDLLKLPSGTHGAGGVSHTERGAYRHTVWQADW